MSKKKKQLNKKYYGNNLMLPLNFCHKFVLIPVLMRVLYFAVYHSLWTYTDKTTTTEIVIIR